MPKAEGYTYDASKKNIYYSNFLSSVDSNHITTPYKVLNNNISGDKFLSNKGMTRAAPYNLYRSPDNKGLSDLAKEGTAVYGKTPNISIVGDDEHSHEQFTLYFGNSKLTLYNGLTEAITSVQYTSGVNFIKIWIAATGAGGGGGAYQGAGGGGGGFAIFPAIIENGDSIVIVPGKTGHAGDGDSALKYWGENGGDTKIFYHEKDAGSNLIAVLQGGWGGCRGNEISSDTGGGGVYLYGGLAERVDNNVGETTERQQTNLPSGWTDLLDTTSTQLFTSVQSEHLKTGASYYSTTYIFAASGENGGQGTSGSVGGSFLSNKITPKKIDYNYPYDLSTWETRGGSDYTGQRSSGGGASAFYQSHGGDGEKYVYPGGYHVGASNGYLGGGGGSGGDGTAGWGGFGAIDIWLPGVTNQIYSSSNGSVSDDYPSGKDVTGEVTVTFKNGDGTVGNQENIVTFSSNTIPSNKSVKLNYVLKTANRDDYSKQQGIKTVDTTQELSWDFSYSSASTEFTGVIESKKAVIV